MEINTVLVTGGAGYIGSHTLVQLIEAGYEPVVVDNFCNASPVALQRVEKITGHTLQIFEVDLRDEAALREVFAKTKPQAVIHFAALKAVGESVSMPLEYYDANVNGSRVLLSLMREFDCHQLVFSSSAVVYGDPQEIPITENSPIGPTNPYGQTKAMVEQMIVDLAVAWPELKAIMLRYFNPVGAHISGSIGEDPQGIPNNLMPYISQVAVGRREVLSVFGNDYDTVDGTGVRDYIHVVDLAAGHLAALEHFARIEGAVPINLGTGNGYSVLQLKEAFEKASGCAVPHQFTPRRPGDIATCYADPSKAAELLEWKAERGVQEMCEDTWRWQSQNPEGFK